ncbi:hypothetical protein BC828DRAFT_386169 [Blastocladiella britannica]|nr:hypothetical protein BC828DRAFT_386169 [Blastocladiella britannica]
MDASIPIILVVLVVVDLAILGALVATGKVLFDTALVAVTEGTTAADRARITIARVVVHVHHKGIADVDHEKARVAHARSHGLASTSSKML